MSSDEDLLPNKPEEIEPSATNIPGADHHPGESRSSSASAWSLAPGDWIAERYEIKRFLGQGGMGEVYEALDEELGELIALKVIKPQIASQPAAIARFKHEIQFARMVSHPNVCRIFDLGVHKAAKPPTSSSGQDLLFLTMELLPGETLGQRVRRERRLEVNEARPIFEQIAQGLAVAHSEGIVHRDIKLSNVMLIPGKDGTRAVITDFGLACSTLSAQDMKPSASGFGKNLAGTPEYISPEQLRGEDATPASDIYSLGVVMYVTLAGELPFRASSRFAGGLQRLVANPPSLTKHVPDLDKNWETLIMRCIERSPQRRFRNCN